MAPAVFPVRIWRHPLASYYAGDLANSADYTDAFFHNLRANGFNAVWLHVVLRDMVAFREKSTPRQQTNVRRLQSIVNRAARHDVGVYLYLCEPRAFEQDHPFWQRFPDARGAPGSSPMDDYAQPTFAICTSTQVGRAYVYENARELFRRVPGIAGAFLITASEHHTHCYSHEGGRLPACPRCRERGAAEVVADVINTIRDAARDAGSSARIFAWNWSWSFYRSNSLHNPEAAIIRRLAADVGIMAGFERGGARTIGGVQREIDEYSLAYVGPSGRFSVLCRTAARSGRDIVAKLQIGTTHELATVPNLPLIGNLHRKLVRLAARAQSGFLGTWNFGTFFTLNTAAVELFLRTGLANRREFLERLATEYFGELNTASFRRAVAGFERAFAWHPFCIPFLYFGPANFSLALPLTVQPPQKRTPLSPAWRLRPRGNDWDASLGPYGLDEVNHLLQNLCDEWDRAFAVYSRVLFPEQAFRPLAWGREAKTSAIALRGAMERPARRLARLRRALPAEALADVPSLGTLHGLHRFEEWCCAFSIGLCMRSCLHVYQLHALHKQPPGSGRDERIAAIMADERGLVERMLPIMRLDERIGWHGEDQHYLFDRPALEAKLDQLGRHLG